MKKYGNFLHCWFFLGGKKRTDGDICSFTSAHPQLFHLHPAVAPGGWYGEVGQMGMGGDGWVDILGRTCKNNNSDV